MAANVTIHHTAFADDRIEYLGTILGCNRYEAIGRLAALWSRCTELQTDRPALHEIESRLGSSGADALVRAGLGERTADGGVRVRGCNGRTEWYGELQDQRSRAGKARAATAKRDALGRLVSTKNHRGTLDPAEPSALDPA